MSKKLNYNLINLQKGLDWYDVSYDDAKIDKLITFYEMVVEKNKVMNLTGITDFDEFVDKHFLDSLAINKAYPEIKDGINVIDVGTGAGFPGIPLAIMFEDSHFTLFDSLNKRMNFIDEVVDALGLTNVDTLCGRAEDFGKDSSYREKYDLCVTRAVAELNVLSELTLPFVKVGGKLIAYKSSKLNDELVSSINAISTFGGNINKIAKVDIPSYDYSNEIATVGESSADTSKIFRIAYDRNLLIIDKVTNTPDKFPRKAGIPKKRPLNFVSGVYREGLYWPLTKDVDGVIKINDFKTRKMIMCSTDYTHNYDEANTLLYIVSERDFINYLEVEEEVLKKYDYTNVGNVPNINEECQRRLELYENELVKHAIDATVIPIVKYEIDNFWPYEHLGLGYCHHCGAKLDTSRFCPKCGVSWV